MIKYFLLTCCFAACIGNKKFIKEYDVLRFKETAFIGNKSVLQDYLLDVPKNGALKKHNTGDAYRQYTIQYKDSSIVYITNDSWGGSRLNFQNRYDKNILSINKKGEYDTLSFQGMQKNGNYWKENFLGDIVVGYVNVKPEVKEEFEKSLMTLRKKTH